MVLVDKENVKGYVQMDEKEHTKKEYASKGLAGTARLNPNLTYAEFVKSLN